VAKEIVSALVLLVVVCLYDPSALGQAATAPGDQPLLAASAIRPGGCPVIEQPSSSEPQPMNLVVPKSMYEQAKVKERLRNLLLDSIRDDSEGRVDLKVEREIKKLIHKLR
jgi:hypothetical protein